VTRPDYAAVAAAAAGHWPDTLTTLGVDDQHLTGRHGPCPGCGGKDRFRFDDRDGRGTWICGGGGNPQAGDGFGLLRHVHGWTAGEALHAVADHLGISGGGTTSATPPKRPAPRPEPPAQPPEPSRTAAYAVELWSRADRDSAAVASHPYARHKGIDWHAAAGRARASGRVIGRDSDCIIVPIRTIPERNVAAVQCINADGAKQTFGPVKGNAFVMGEPRDRTAEWFVVEGWADAASLFREVHRSVVFAAMGKEFDVLAERIAEAYRPRRLVLLEDAA
jgi:putative DNA primase/helicase